MSTVSAEPTQTCTRFVATIFAKPSSPLLEEHINDFISNIRTALPDSVANSRLLNPSPGPSTVAEVSFTSPSQHSLQTLRSLDCVSTWEARHNSQVAIQLDNVFRRYKRLAVFDMDSTLIQQEVIDEIARKLGVEDKVSAITERAMNGELDFAASLRERCSLLRGVSSSVFEELKPVITLSPGASSLVVAFKKLGYTTAVLSGGFTPLASWLAQNLGLDYAYANNLVVSEDGLTLTGEVAGVIVDSHKKSELLQSIAAEHHICLDQVIAIGDGANDLPMMWKAGLGVAFNAKARVQRDAPVKLNSTSLADVLYLLGLTNADQDQLLSDSN